MSGPTCLKEEDKWDLNKCQVCNKPPAGSQEGRGKMFVCTTCEETQHAGKTATQFQGADTIMAAARSCGYLTGA